MRATMLLLPALWLPVAMDGPSSNDPEAVHRFLRENVGPHRSVRRLLGEWQRRTGDQSFSSFEVPSPELASAMRRQAAAFDLWQEGDADGALRGYRIALNILLSAQAHSEAAFCLYYMAEILFEADRPQQSLALVGRALDIARTGSSRRDYLEALLLQSRGYSLWFMDQIEAAVDAFGQAQARWRRLGYRPGAVANWNNLAVLHEELQLPRRAELFYRRALRELTEDVHPAIRLQLNLNFGLLLANEGRREEALHWLSEATRDRAAEPFEFLLNATRIQPERYRAELLKTETKSTVQEWEKTLALAKTADDPGRRIKLLQEARRLSRGISQARRRRTSQLELAREFEKSKQYSEALGLYREALRARPPGARPEFFYPFSRAASPAVDGTIRCLVNLNRWDAARQEIQAAARRRRQRAFGLVRTEIEIGKLEDELDGLLAEVRLAGPSVGRLHSGTRQSSPFHDRSSSPDRASYPCDRIDGNFRPGGFSVLELWPSEREIFVWILNPTGTVFRRLPLSVPISRLTRDLLKPLHLAESSLPPAPSRRLLSEAYEELFAPLEEDLETTRLLVIGHGELQRVPLELLMDGDGEYLLRSFIFSYLPSACLPTAPRGVNDRPIFWRPADSRAPGWENERAELRRLFPGLRSVNSIGSSTPLRAPLIHVSSHFMQHPVWWLNSGIPMGTDSISLSRFLNQPLESRLLTLAMCDTGNTVLRHSPYALGIAELLLSRPVGGVIVSRWKLDRRSLEIYFGLLRRIRDGAPVDLALAQARRRFIAEHTRHGRAIMPAAHPFFWAGITYVGAPGRRVFEPGTLPSWIFTVHLVLAALALLWWRIGSGRAHASPSGRIGGLTSLFRAPASGCHRQSKSASRASPGGNHAASS